MVSLAGLTVTLPLAVAVGLGLPFSIILRDFILHGVCLAGLAVARLAVPKHFNQAVSARPL